MDDIDRAQARAEQFTADCEHERQYQAAHAQLPAVGACHYCSEPLGHGLRFCDADCRDAWEHEQRLKRLAGVA